MTQEATWAVVLTADEPAALVLANVGWHLGTGAAEVHLYLDRPDDPLAALTDVPGLHVTVCDDAHWQALGEGRPELQMRRQSLNANHAKARCRADWLVHLDADEFVLQDRPLGRELAHVASLDAELNLPAWERAYLGAPEDGLFDGVLRGSTKGRPGFDDQILGRQRKLRHHGLLAHSAGKCAVPVAGNFRIGIHNAYRGPRKGAPRAASYGSTHARLLHFDGLTPLHWHVKMLRYAAHSEAQLTSLVSDPRKTQVIRYMRRLAKPGQAAAFHDLLRVLDESACDRLEAFGLLDRAGFDPGPVAERVLHRRLDLSVAGFDAALRARQPELTALVDRHT
ncbi:glycosyltransferase family 2 protein [Mesobacterium pallidum]|uniref:glycosyltransferase family 2 protein n=1 Tax=Mesobacterium pallidum TaxID=2872037 RepID=UPI001EE3050A|nr:glycosyltransferase family 2 protein [Mesobacterium pallidum]